MFFLDPPYYGLADYRFSLKPEDYDRLRDTLAAIGGKFLLTINDCPETRRLFGGYIMEEVTVPYSISRDSESRGRYGELMIRNYELEGMLL